MRLPALLLGLAALLAAPGALAEPPADGYLAWASNREDGRHEIYLQVLATGAVTRLTHEGGKAPRWSPDGRWISYYHPGDRSVHVVRWDGSEDHEVCDAAPVKDALAALWPHDSSGLLCVHATTTDGAPDQEYRLFDPESGENALLFRQNEFPHLRGWRFEPGGLTHDGRYLVGWVVGLFRNGYTADNGSFVGEHATVVLDVQDKQRLYYFGSGCLSATPPAGPLIYHVSRDCPAPPDISRMSVDDLMTRESYELELGHVDGAWGHEYMPDISNDGVWMVYAASRGCHDWYECDYDVFLHRLGAEVWERQKLVEDPANDNFPSLYVGEPWSRDAPDAEAPGRGADGEEPGDDAADDELCEDGADQGKHPVHPDDDPGDAVTGASGGPACGCGIASAPRGALGLLLLGLVLRTRRSARSVLH